MAGAQTEAGNRIGAALEGACRSLLAHQHSDGHFEGDIDQGTAPTAQVVIVEHFLGVLDPEDAAQAVRWLWSRVQPDGGFLSYPGATFCTMTETCCGYGALAAAGVPAGDPRRARVRSWIEAHGGFSAADPITMAYLVMAGALPASVLPPTRIEHVLIPGVERHVVRSFLLFYGVTIAFIVPGLLHGLRRAQARPLSTSLAARAEGRIIDYLLNHQNPEGNWAGSQWVTSMALGCLKALGVPLDHDAIIRGLASLRRLRRRGEDGLRVLSLNADVWNTSMALRVLSRAGFAGGRGQGALGAGLDGWARGAIDYLLASQASVAAPADWTNARSGAPRAGGWAFEADNPLSTDVDTTSVTLLALADFTADERVPTALTRGLRWLQSMQHEDGGFGAYSRPTRVAPPGPLFMSRPEPPKGLVAMAGFFWRPPFEFVETPTADLTSRVVCALAKLDRERNAAAIAAAVRYLHSQQWRDAWWGRWTTNYVAGTAFVLQGLCAAGDDVAAPPVRRGVRWLLSHQNPDGGFGEQNETYEKPELAGQGPSISYLTGLVLHALCATGHGKTEAAARAAAHLCDTQRPDGLWEEFQALQSMAPPELFYKNFVNFQTAAIEGLAVYRETLASS